MEGETPPPPPPVKIARGNLPPPAEVEGETQPPPLLLPACVSKVLDDDNLLTEIIVRLGFPTSLVRAAAVCRRWLRLASDRAFLRRFRKIHPPRLLGFYVAQSGRPDPGESSFVTLPQPPPPELAAVVRRASFSLDKYKGKQTDIVGCWNGRVVTSQNIYHVFNRNRSEIFLVHSPLCSERGMAVIPALEITPEKGSFCSRLLFSKEEGDAVSYFYVMLEHTNEGKSMVQVYILQDSDDAWCSHLTLTVDYVINALDRAKGVLVDNKIYMASSHNEIAVLDLMASSISTIQLPQGVDFRAFGTTVLSRADDTSVYLIHAKELQLHIWHHKGGNWLLVDNICLREMCPPFLVDEHTSLVHINHVGDYTGAFLFLEIGWRAFYLDVKCRTLCKVHEMRKEDQCFGNIYTFMMIWPPIFPVLKDGPARFASLPSDDLYIALVEVT